MSHHGPARYEQLTGARGMARIQWFAVTVEHEHPTRHGLGGYCLGASRRARRLRSGRFACRMRVTPGGAGEPALGLPSTVLHTSCPAIGPNARAPFRPYPGVVC